MFELESDGKEMGLVPGGGGSEMGTGVRRLLSLLFNVEGDREGLLLL